MDIKSYIISMMGGYEKLDLSSCDTENLHVIYATAGALHPVLSDCIAGYFDCIGTVFSFFFNRHSKLLYIMEQALLEKDGGQFLVSRDSAICWDYAFLLKSEHKEPDKMSGLYAHLCEFAHKLEELIP